MHNHSPPSSSAHNNNYNNNNNNNNNNNSKSVRLLATKSERLQNFNLSTGTIHHKFKVRNSQHELREHELREREGFLFFLSHLFIAQLNLMVAVKLFSGWSFSLDENLHYKTIYLHFIVLLMATRGFCSR